MSNVELWDKFIDALEKFKASPNEFTYHACINAHKAWVLTYNGTYAEGEGNLQKIKETLYGPPQ